MAFEGTFRFCKTLLGKQRHFVNIQLEKLKEGGADASPIVKERGDVLFPPGIEPGTLRVLGARDNHYTTETQRALDVDKLRANNAQYFTCKSERNAPVHGPPVHELPFIIFHLHDCPLELPGSNIYDKLG